jgi:hypothetical protein
MNAVLLLYVPGGLVTFWAAFILAGMYCELDVPSPTTTAVVALIAGVVWPLAVTGAIEVWGVAVLMQWAGKRAGGRRRSATP